MKKKIVDIAKNYKALSADNKAFISGYITALCEQKKGEKKC